VGISGHAALFLARRSIWPSLVCKVQAGEAEVCTDSTHSLAWHIVAKHSHFIDQSSSDTFCRAIQEFLADTTLPIALFFIARAWFHSADNPIFSQVIHYQAQNDYSAYNKSEKSCV